jgi:hypothetical protein
MPGLIAVLPSAYPKPFYGQALSNVWRLALQGHEQAVAEVKTDVRCWLKSA